MSRLYLRGKSVWIDYRDQHRVLHSKPTGFKIDSPKKRNGKWVFPEHILEWKRTFDAGVVLGKWGMDDENTKQPIRYSEAVDKYLLTAGSALAKSTIGMYRLAEKKFKELLGDCYLSEVTTEDMYHFRTQMLKDDGEQNTAAWLRHIGPIFSWAIAEGLITRNPITKKVRLNPASPLPVCYSVDQLKAIFEAADTRYPGLSDQFRFLIFSGFRSAESCQAIWERVHFDRKTIEFYNIKGRRYDNHPLDPDFISFLRSIPRTHAPYLFLYRDIWALNKPLRKINDNLAHGERYNVHTFKSNAVERWRLMGKDMFEVSRLAHHKSIQTTLRHYAIFNNDIFEDETERRARLEVLRGILLQSPPIQIPYTAETQSAQSNSS